MSKLLLYDRGNVIISLYHFYNVQGWNFLSDVFSATSGFKSPATSRGGSNPTSRKSSNVGLKVTGLGSRRASGSVLSGYGYDLEVASARSR